MKKQISLLMSFMLIAVMIFSVSVQASTPLQIKPAMVEIDLANAQSASLSYLNGNASLVIDGETTAHKVASTSTTLQTIIASSDGYTNVARIKKSSSKTPYWQLILKEADGTTIDNGILKLTSKILITEAFDSSKRYFRIIHTGGGSAGTAQKMNSDFLPNVWYDTTWTIDMEASSDNVTLSFVPILSAQSSGEVASRTISYTYSYTQSDISYLRIDLLPSTTNGHIYWADLKTVHYPNTTYNKAEILDIGSSGEVAYEQNNIRVKLSDEIPSLKLEHISIKNAGGQDVAISSAAVSSDGTYYYVDVITANPLPAWTQYDLTISKDAWGKGAIQSDASSQGPVTDITASFFTPAAPFDMKDPIFSISAGKLKADTTIINTTGTPEDVTLAVVIYGADGRVKSVTAQSFDNFEAAYPGTAKSVVGGNFESGDTAKLIAINGWTNKTALFGKYWQTGYSELN